VVDNSLWKAILTFVGVVVGAGILGLPYVMSRVGFLTGIFVLIIMAVIFAFSYLIVGEVCQRTKGKHQLVGLVGKYLGKRWRIIMGLITILGLYGALMAYSIAAGQILSSFLGGKPLIYSILFVLILSILLFFNLRVFASFESIFSLVKIIICFVIGLYLLKDINIGNLISFDIKNFVFPLGVVMFALTGLNILPVMNLELKNKKDFRKAVLIGLGISVVIYIIFCAVLVGLMGLNTPEVATVGLTNHGSFVFLAVNLFALFALVTAFVGLGFALKEIYIYDYNLIRFNAWILVFILTLSLVLFNNTSFIKVLGLTGAISSGLVLILLFYLHSVAKMKSELTPTYRIGNFLVLKIILSLLFLFVLINEIFGFFVV
jgi:amino acid permease